MLWVVVIGIILLIIFAANPQGCGLVIMGITVVIVLIIFNISENNQKSTKASRKVLDKIKIE